MLIVYVRETTGTIGKIGRIMCKRDLTRNGCVDAGHGMGFPLRFRVLRKLRRLIVTWIDNLCKPSCRDLVSLKARVRVY